MEKDVIRVNPVSEEIHDIVNAVPSWIIRSGIAMVFLFMALFLTLSIFIRYPDVIRTNLRIISLSGPEAVLSKRAGKLVELIATDKKLVRKNEPLAMIGSTASYADIVNLSATLTEFNADLNNGKDFKEVKLSNLNLGELQHDFQIFYRQYFRCLSVLPGGYYMDSKEHLLEYLEKINGLRKLIIDQRLVHERERIKVTRKYNVYEKLYREGEISTAEFRQQEKKYLAVKQVSDQSLTALISNQNSADREEKKLADINRTIAREKAEFHQSVSQLCIVIDKWLRDYVVVAPVSGVLNYTGILKENQSVNAKQEIFKINPGDSDFFGEIQIPQSNMAKIKKGQPVIIKLDGFPFEQYGIIRGKINYISDVAAENNNFVARVLLDKAINKETFKEINLKSGMLANAEIVLTDRSLFQRLLFNNK